jgi:hypothetical protein
MIQSIKGSPNNRTSTNVALGDFIIHSIKVLPILCPWISMEWFVFVDPLLLTTYQIRLH